MILSQIKIEGERWKCEEIALIVRLMLVAKSMFVGAQDWPHLRKREIYEKLDSLLDQIKVAGYVPHLDSIPLDIDNSMKEKLHLQ